MQIMIVTTSLSSSEGTFETEEHVHATEEETEVIVEQQ